MIISPKKILVIYAFDPNEPETIRRWTHHHHLHALDYSPHAHDIVYYNVFDALQHLPNKFDIPSGPQKTPSFIKDKTFDVLILHYSFLCYRWLYVSAFDYRFFEWKNYFRWIGEVDCIKIAIPQDEADHCEVLDEWLFDWSISAVMTNFGAEGVKVIYPLLSQYAKFYACHPGYIDNNTAERYIDNLLPLEKRPLDIVYRARHLPYYVGARGQLKWIIGDEVAKLAIKHGLKVDISTRHEDTIYEGWYDFLASSKATLGCEGGFSAPNWRGEYRDHLEILREDDPQLTFADFNARMPRGWDGYEQLAITGPRHFEAVFTKTCQVLVEGRYRGVLQADKHYIPIKKDLSNLDEVLEKLKDYRYMKEMIDCAYEEIYLSGKYTYRAFAGLIEQAILDQDQKHRTGHQESDMIKTNTETEEIIKMLQKQVIAERHHNVWLEAKLLRSARYMEPSLKVRFITRTLREGIKLLWHEYKSLSLKVKCVVIAILLILGLFMSIGLVSLAAIALALWIR